MQSRRQFIKKSALSLGSLISISHALSNANAKHKLLMPEESERHHRTWMAFVANDYIWSQAQIPAVKANLVAIAQTIAKYEPVSMLVNPEDYHQAQQLFGDITAQPFPIELIEFAIDDLWLRDTGPTFVRDSVALLSAIDFNFNGWGNKQRHNLDRQVAKFIAKQSNAALISTNLVLEGGCFEVDGQGTAILTESCVINDNRNPLVDKQQIEQQLKHLLGLSKIIWLKGIKGRDITDAHTDFYARFTSPGEVMVNRDNYIDAYDYQITRNNIATLHNSTDAQGRKLKLLIVDTPATINEKFGSTDFAAGYLGYYLCNGAVILQQFGDKFADENARKILQKAFPNRVIEQLVIDGIASGGGSIHCATQQQIKI